MLSKTEGATSEQMEWDLLVKAAVVHCLAWPEESKIGPVNSSLERRLMRSPNQRWRKPTAYRILAYKAGRKSKCAKQSGYSNRAKNCCDKTVAGPDFGCGRIFCGMLECGGLGVKKVSFGFMAALAVSLTPAAAAGQCEMLCRAEFYQLATVAVIQELLDTGVDVNAKDTGFKSPLHWVAAADPEMIRLLITAGADVNARDALKRTPLHFVSATGSAENIIILLNAGADVNARTANNWTPLHGVAKYGTAENIRILLDAGADASASNDMGETPFDLASTNEQLKESDAYLILKDATGN